MYAILVLVKYSMSMRILCNVLQADVITDGIIFRHLCESGCVETISSEEFPEARSGGGKGFSVSEFYQFENPLPN